MTYANDVHCKLYSFDSLHTCKYPTRLSNVVIITTLLSLVGYLKLFLNLDFTVFLVIFLGTYNVSGVHLVTTGRATGNIFMIFSVAMRCRWLCGVCSIQSAFSSL